MKYSFYSDPGHGWLKVPKAKLKELGIADKISPYSYQRGDWAYLEEDGDLSTFVTAVGIDNYNYKQFNTDKQSKIRNYEAYTNESV